MVKTKQTKLVKGSASSKKLNLQLQRTQNRAKELQNRKKAKQSKTRSLKMPKIRREQSAHESKKLNEWTPKEMEEAVNMYRNSRVPGYKGKPVSDSVCRLISFSGVLSSIQKTGSLYHIFILQLSIREVARQFPKIGYTILQGRLSGRVLG